MEFLFGKGFRAVGSNTREALAKSTTFKNKTLPYTAQNDDFYVFSTIAPYAKADHSSKQYVFDGHVFHGKKFLHEFLSPETGELASLYSTLQEHSFSQAAGVFCVAELDFVGGKFQLYCDPLSQYPIAYWQQGDRYLVSNNALLIEAFLQTRGYKLQRNTECLLLSSLAVLNLSGTSPFIDVAFLPPRTALRGGRRLEFDQQSEVSFLCSPPTNYEELIQLAADNLKNKCAALFDSLPGHYFLTDLTGGIDTRVVLAGLLASGKENEIAAWSNVKYPHPDANVADHLIDKYQLPHGALMLNWVNEWPELEQKIRRGLFRNRGGRYKDWAGLGTGYFPKLVRLGGVFGEIGRSNVYASVFNNNDIGLGDIGSAVRDFSLGSSGFEFVTRPGQELLSRQVDTEVSQLAGRGIARSNMSDVFYLDGRGRYHFGHQSACHSNLNINPVMLYDLNLLWANMCLPLEQRAAGKAQFDLIRALAGDELAKVPMADKRWLPEALPKSFTTRQRDDYLSAQIITRDSAPLPASGESMQWQFCWPTDKIELKPPPPPPEWARGRSGAWLQFTSHQAIASKLLAETDGNEMFFDYVDREKLISLTTAEPASSIESAVTSLAKIVGGLLWFMRGEERVQISEEYFGSYPP